MEYKAKSILGFVMFMVSNVLYFFSYATLLLGIALYFTPAYIKELNGLLSKSKKIETETIKDTTFFFATNRKFIGTLLLLGSMEVTYFFAFDMDVEAFRRVWASTKMEIFFTDIIFETIRVSFVIGGVASFIFLLFFIFAPERYKKISAYTDNWVSNRMILLPLEKDRAVEGSIFFEHHKMFGVFITLGSLYSIIRLGGLPSAFKF